MYKFFAVTLVALSLAACSSNEGGEPVAPTPPVTECGEGQVYEEGKGGCVPADAVVADPSAPADAAVVPAEGIAVTVDPAVAAKAE